MGVNPAEVIAQANPNAVSPDSDEATQIAASSAPGAKSTDDRAAESTGTGQYANPGNVIFPGLKIPQTKPVPKVDLGSSWDTSVVRPGSMAFHMANMMMSPTFAGLAQKYGPMGAFAFTAPAVVADAHQGVNPQPQTPSAGEQAGNVTWEAAQQDDTSKPVNPQQLPKENIGHKVRRGMEDTLGELFDMRPGSMSEHAQRMEEENRTNALNALTNIQMVREQQLLHRQSQEVIDKAAQTGASQFAFLTTAPDAKIVAEGKTSDEIRQMLQGPNNPNGALNPHTMQIFQTGRVQVGTDKTGEPLYRSTYSVLIPGGPITMGLSPTEKGGNALEGAKFTPEQREAAEKQEDIRKYLNINVPGLDLKAGQTLPSTQYGALMQVANNVAGMRTAAIAANKLYDDQVKMAEWSKHDKEFAANPLVANAIKDNWGSGEDPFYLQKAFVQIKTAIMRGDTASQDLKQKLGPDWENQYIRTFGNGDPKQWKSMMDQYYASVAKSQETLDTAITDQKFAIEHSDKVEAAAFTALTTQKSKMQSAQKVVNDSTAFLNDPKNQGPELAEQRAKAQADIKQATADFNTAKDRAEKLQNTWNIAHAANEGSKEQAGLKSGAEAAAKENAEKEVNKPTTTVLLTPEIEGQIQQLPAARQAVLKQYDSNTQAALMAVAYGNGEQDISVFPPRLTKGAPGIAQQQALGVIHQLNPEWSMQSYKQKMNAYKSATSGKLADQRDSLNNFIGHAAEARRVNDQFARMNLKIYDIARNKLSKAGYGTQAVALGEALSVVNEEFQTMIKSGFAPTSEMEKAQKVLVDEDATVGQVNAALKVMAEMAGVRAHTMNNRYKGNTGDAFPNLISPENVDDAKYLGIDLAGLYTGGRIGGSGNSPLNQQTQTGRALGNVAAPEGASNTVYARDGKTVIGHVVNNKFVPLGAK